MGDVIDFPAPMLPLIPYDTGYGLLLWLPPNHPAVRDTPEATKIRNRWDRLKRAKGRPLL